MLLAIDPGADTGWALIAPTGLAACGLGAPDHWFLPGAPDHWFLPTLDRVVIERPMIYPGGKSRPNDIITLALSAGELAGKYRPLAPVEYVLPVTWKGNVPKDIAHARMWARLSDAEKEVVDRTMRTSGPKGRPLAAGKRHNVLDAVALALWGVGRGR